MAAKRTLGWIAGLACAVMLSAAHAQNAPPAMEPIGMAEMQADGTVVLTLRADFVDRPLEYVDFGELMRERMTFVVPMTPDELQEAVLGPAQRVGLVLEPGLAERIGRELGDQPGMLPLLHRHEAPDANMG